MSLGDMRGATGIDPSNLSKLERGEYLTTIERYVAIADALGVPLDRLFHQPRRAA